MGRQARMIGGTDCQAIIAQGGVTGEDEYFAMLARK
jgi:hypothetical protein